jgi:hypothetical protein
MDVTRRLLLPAVLEELFVVVGESHGVHSFRMGDLRTAPEDVLGSVVPAHEGAPARWLARQS